MAVANAAANVVAKAVANVTASSITKTLTTNALVATATGTVTPGSSTVGGTIKSGGQALWMSFLVILVTEIGDKTFLISAVMAMRHSRLLIFAAALAALGPMTILSALVGHMVPTLLSKEYTQLAAAGLFIVFGIRMFLEGYRMTGNEGQEELEEVTQELMADKDGDAKIDNAERGETSNDSKGKEDPRSCWIGWKNLAYYLLSPVFIQTFVLTFLAEWGDRSQISTIAMAGADDFWWVTIGSIAGHIVCSAIAVIGGRLLASRISIKSVTLVGAVLFVAFGVVGVYQWVYGIESD